MIFTGFKLRGAQMVFSNFIPKAMRPPAGSRPFGKSRFDGSPSRRLKTPTAPRRSPAFGFLVATIWAATPLATLAETPAAQCIAEIRAQFGTNPAFKVICTGNERISHGVHRRHSKDGDGVLAKGGAYHRGSARLSARDQRFGPTLSRGQENGSEVCSIAELKPFGEHRLTTSFRAACLAIHAD